MEGDASPTATTPAEVIARRLNHLFATFKQPNGRKFTDEQVATYVTTETGKPCTRQWIAELRKGDKRAPELARLQAIAGFFGVPRDYLFGDDKSSGAVDEDIETGRALKQLEANGLHLRHLQDLAPDQVRIVADLIKSLARHNQDGEAS